MWERGYLVWMTAYWQVIYSIYTRIIHKAPWSGLSVFFVRQVEPEREWEAQVFSFYCLDFNNCCSTQCRRGKDGQVRRRVPPWHYPIQTCSKGIRCNLGVSWDTPAASEEYTLLRGPGCLLHLNLLYVRAFLLTRLLGRLPCHCHSEKWTCSPCQRKGAEI